jgi:hypothetical protein
VAVPVGVNRSFQDPRPIPGRIRIFEPGPRFEACEERTLRTLSREAADVSSRYRFLKHPQGLDVPSATSSSAPFRAEAAI